jgi:hypothetical protein
MGLSKKPAAQPKVSVTQGGFEGLDEEDEKGEVKEKGKVEGAEKEEVEWEGEGYGEGTRNKRKRSSDSDGSERSGSRGHDRDFERDRDKGKDGDRDRDRNQNRDRDRERARDSDKDRDRKKIKEVSDRIGDTRQSRGKNDDKLVLRTAQTRAKSTITATCWLTTGLVVKCMNKATKKLGKAKYTCFQNLLEYTTTTAIVTITKCIY